MFDNVNFVFFNMFCDFNIMSIEWQMIFDFSQTQMNDLKNFFDRTINNAIEIAFVQQINQMIEMLQIFNDNVIVFVSIISNALTFSTKRWNSITNEQKQFVFESILDFEQFFFQFDQNEFAFSVSFVSSFATISFFSFINFRSTIISFSRWFRFVLKRALIALLTTHDVFLFFCRFVSSSMIFFWRVVRSLYHDFVKQEFD